MSYTLYKRIMDDDGELCNDPTWHLMGQISYCDTYRLMCTGEAYDSSADLALESKEVKRGGITCKLCMNIVKEIKAIKL